MSQSPTSGSADLSDTVQINVLTGQPPKRIQTWSADNFLKREFPPKEPLAKGLIHRRDIAVLGGRRREGKTTFLTYSAIALTAPEADFLGYEIQEARRVLFFVLEDDPGEYQDKLRKVVEQRELGGRLKVVTRDDFIEAGISIDIDDGWYRAAVLAAADQHKPDLIIFDNLAHLVGADYNDSKKIHALMSFLYGLAKKYNTAVILAAHPRKGNPERPVALRTNPTEFFESIMGSSHLINSCGSLWGLERPDSDGYSTFLGGRQRVEGNHQFSNIQVNDNGRLELVSDLRVNLQLALKSTTREQAWTMLPPHPTTFGYRDGERAVKPAMKSSQTYHAFINNCKRLGIIVETADKKLMKAPGTERVSADANEAAVMDATELEGV